MAILEEEELKSYDSDLITLIGELDKQLVHATTLLEAALITVTKKVADYSTCNSSCAIDLTLTCNTEEADTRMWLHASKTNGENMLVYSPDTDALYISMLMVNPILKDVCLQVNPLGKA